MKKKGDESECLNEKGEEDKINESSKREKRKIFDHDASDPFEE